jgi:hypothetical protein
VFGLSARRLPLSNDWMKTGDSRRFQPRFSRDARSLSSSGRPMPRKYVELLRELEHLIERRDLELAVVGVRAEGQPFLRAQGLDLGEREVLGEPAGHRLAVDGLGGLAVRKLHGDVGGPADLVLVTRDQDAVLGRHQIGLDEVRPHLRRQPVRRQGVLGAMPARAPMADDERA